MSVTPPTKTDPTAPAAGRRRSGSRPLVAWRGVLAAVVVGLLSASSAPSAMAADTCANAAVRTQTGSTALPDCRAYEMVSPPYKGGFPIDPGLLSFTDDGVVSYRSLGSFSDNTQGAPLNRYHAVRSAAGWLTSSVAPSEVLYNTGGADGIESPDLRSSVWVMSRRDVPGDTGGFYRRDHAGVFTRIGDAGDDVGPRIPVGVSADLSHLVFNHGPQGGHASDFYEYVGTGNGPIARAVSVDNLGQNTPSETCPNTVSADGRVIVYTSGCGLGVRQVWARVAGSASVAVSGSECTRSSGDPGGACNGPSSAAYEGAAVDGSRVFFTTRQQLVNGDTDTGSSTDEPAGNDLYACDIPPGAPAPVGVANRCASLIEISGTASNARVEDVVAVSRDGSRVYFVAQGALAGNLGVGGVGPMPAPEPPATVPVPHNLYVWERDGSHPAGTTRFVARLDASDVAQGQMTPDGRYLLFLTASNLVTEGPGADADGAVDAYRYDAVTRTMIRVSTAVSGRDGNTSGADISLTARGSAMTADGSTVIFDTAEALSAVDTDGVTDVYSWHDDGRVSLISVGGGNSTGISPSGRDIFFTTDAPILTADGDFNKDIYDARLGGGFAVEQQPPCAGDGCRGQRSQPPSLAEPSGPWAGGLGPVVAPPAFSLRAVSATQRKALAATGRVSLTVTANAPGTVSVKATASIGGRSVTVGSARRSLTVPGRVSVSLVLSKRARSQLAARGRLTVKIEVSHSKVALDRSVTLRLVHTKAKAKRSLKRVAERRSIVVDGSRS